ncbi:MAG: hypothetical protein IPM42_13790 [Saprospiraceae bacterium]|nr:hypothetical protein [Saprospiraceae bacterium]
MQRNHYIVIASAIALLLVLYFGFDTVPGQQKLLEKSRAMVVESTGLQNLLNDARPKLDKEQNSVIDALEMDLRQASEDSIKVIKLKALSGTWYRFGYPAIAGIYANDVAEIIKTEESWSMTGTTFSICVKKEDDEKVKTFCSNRAVRAFENAISLNPDKIEPKINLALCYVDNPSADNPMQGILLLRELDTKYPDNVLVLNQLARLAIQTGQNDRAIERLEKVLSIDPENQTAICLAAKAYRASGQEAKALSFEQKCIN